MHFDLQFKTRLDHVSLKMESITLLWAQTCVLQRVQNMQSLGSFPSQTLMPPFGSLLCACLRAQETAVNTDPLSSMESPAGLYPKIKHPAATYHGALSPTCRQHLPDCLSLFLVLYFSFHLGKFSEQFRWYRTRHRSESIPLEWSLLLGEQTPEGNIIWLFLTCSGLLLANLFMLLLIFRAIWPLLQDTCRWINKPVL